MPADAVVTSTDVAARAPHFRYLDWGPVIAGAIGTAAIAFVLYTFGSALGLSAVSTDPYRGLSGPTFFVVATLYAAVVQVVAYAAGGYLAGRMRIPWLDGTEGERYFRDGAHGFAVWALGVVFTAIILASGASGALKTAVEATTTMGAGAAAGAASNLANRVSTEPADYAADLLLRPGAQGAAGSQGQQAASTDRAPLVRTFAASLRSGSMSDRDRTYMAQTVARQTGLPQAEAEKRVDEALAEARSVEQRARDAAEEARKKSALAGFITAATLAVACAAACVAAGLGARDRDQRTAAYWMGAQRFW
jgi:hypothetical protein